MAAWASVPGLSGQGGAAEHRVGRLAPDSLLVRRRLLVTVLTIEIQFPRKRHSLSRCRVDRQSAVNATAMIRDAV